VNVRSLLVLALAGTWGVVPSGRAAEPLRLQEAVSRALASHPTLAAEAAQLRSVEARAQREGLSTPYVVSGDLENVAGTGALSGVESAETTLRLGRVIELGGKREARQSLGAAEVAQQRHVADTARLEIASRTTTRFIEVVADQRRVEFARERVKQAERTRREVANWVAAARNPESDLSAAEIAVAEAELELEHAQHELASARVTLASSWGLSQPDFETVTAELSDLPATEPFESLSSRLPMTTSQRAAQLEADLLQARRRVAVASGKPDISVAVGARRLEALGDQGLVMSVSVPLGSRSRSSLAVAEADAQLAALDARRDAQQSEAHQALFEKYQELVHTRTEYEAVRTKMLPKAEQALAFTRRGFEAGRFSFVSLAQAQKTVFDLRARSVDAAARYHTLLVEVDRLTAATPDSTP
jgi:cobalt-zinc-cadmium efflux system outer membrane protein